MCVWWGGGGGRERKEKEVEGGSKRREKGGGKKEGDRKQREEGEGKRDNVICPNLQLPLAYMYIPYTRVNKRNSLLGAYWLLRACFFPGFAPG